MKKVLFLLIVLLAFSLSACGGEEEVKNEQIFAIYTMAVEANTFDGTYEEWLETIKGEQGIPGSDGESVVLSVSDGYIKWKHESSDEWTNLIAIEDLVGENGANGQNGDQIEIRYDSNYVQWKYTNDSSWENLFSTDVLTGSSGQDGREVEFNVEGNKIQWRYNNESTWTDLIELNVDKYYLTDDEINLLLGNYNDDMIDLFPTIDLLTLNDTSYDNLCTSVDFEDCHTLDNYPMIFGEGYERYAEKENSVQLLSDIMSIISDLMGSYESEPIVPTDHLSGSEAFATVTGRNTTSVLFEGQLNGSVPTPIDLPVDVEFTYQLLMYKSVEDSKIYVEGVIDITGGLAFVDVSTFKTSFVSTYNFNEELETFVYTTDVIGFDEWVTIMKPTQNGTEIFSTNLDSIEYYNLDGSNLDILYSTNWYEDNHDFVYELYNDNDLVYILEDIDDIITYKVPLTSFNGWDLVEYTEDSKFGDNEFLYKFSLTNTLVQEGLILETPLLTEPAWIMLDNFNYYYDNDSDLEKDSLNNVIFLQAESKADMETFVGTDLTYNQTSDWMEYSSVITTIDNYTYLDFVHSTEDTSGIFIKFNLRD